MLSQFHRQQDEPSTRINPEKAIVRTPLPTVAATGILQTNSHTEETEVEEHFYTSALKELGDAEGSLPTYTSTQVSYQPIRWKVTVHYRDFRSSAEASSSRAAKHSASKSLWIQMGKRVIVNSFEPV